MYAYAAPVRRNGAVAGAVAIFHDPSYIDLHGSKTRHAAAVRLPVQVFLIGLITLLMVRWSMTRPIGPIAQWVQEVRAGRSATHMELPVDSGFEPLTVEVRKLATSLRVAQASADEEARLRGAAQAYWTAERLRVYIGNILRDSRLFGVSNREPYEHVRQGGAIAVKVPASGLVTALEPILRACDGNA